MRRYRPPRRFYRADSGKTLLRSSIFIKVNDDGPYSHTLEHVAVPLSYEGDGSMVWEEEDADRLVLEQCATVLNRLHERVAHRFRRGEVRARVRRYVAGLLEWVDHKNGWQVAEAMGEAGPQGIQHLLTTAAWDAEAVRDDLRRYVVEYLGDAPSGVLIVDEIRTIAT